MNELDATITAAMLQLPEVVPAASLGRTDPEDVLARVPTEAIERSGKTPPGA